MVLQQERKENQGRKDGRNGGKGTCYYANMLSRNHSTSFSFPAAQLRTQTGHNGNKGMKYRSEEGDKLLLGFSSFLLIQGTSMSPHQSESGFWCCSGGSLSSVSCPLVCFWSWWVWFPVMSPGLTGVFMPDALHNWAGSKFCLLGAKISFSQMATRWIIKDI